MKKLYCPEDEVELSIILSILNGDKIRYFVHNNYFGSLKIGPKIDLFNMKTIMVDERDEERAKELLDDYLKIKNQQYNKKTEYTLLNKLRVIIEFLFFGWFIPGSRHKKFD